MSKARAKALMFMGTGSDVGKSLIVAGLCRHFTNQGLRVQPFKPQNMSNNAAVTVDGGEIGRAQALQARACRLAPHVHMNPVLLKPQSEIGSQIVVHGKMRGSAKAAEYQRIKPTLLPEVIQSFDHQKSQADLVLVEGAGSASEVNLRKGDIANWGFATATRTPVALIGDIDRGGVIAAIVGTHHLISEAEKSLLAGYLINKFRGDPALFDTGLDLISRETGLSSFGIAPYFFDAHKLPAEDALALDQIGGTGGIEGIEGQSGPTNSDQRTSGQLNIVVLRTPRLSNFDDMDPLMLEPHVAVQFLKAGDPIPAQADLVILGGSKATIADLAFIKSQGWDIDLRAHVRRGGRVLGLCGGYQMLGTHIDDPHGIEGPGQSVAGLGLLNITTTLTPEKALREVRGHHVPSGEALNGYEMHIGQTTGPDCARAYLDLGGRPDGAQSADGRVCGTYVHGHFSTDRFRRAWLNSLGARGSDLAFDAQIDQTLDDLADHLARTLDVEAILDAATPR